MKQSLLLTLVGFTLITGCARRYVMTLNNGSRVTTLGKPRLQGGNYIVKDLNGQPAYVPAGRVEEIAPASMVKEKKSQFLPSTSK